MKKQFCALSLLFCLPALLTACAGAATPGAEPAILSTTFPTATLTQPPTSTPLPATATPTATISPQCTQYTLTAELDYPQHRLTISEAVSYSNRSADKLSALVFVVEPDRQAGEFQLTSLHWADGNAVQGFTLAGGELTLPLMQPLAPGQTVEVSLTYMLDLPSARGVLSFDSRQVNLAGWYPYLPPYIEGEGWRINPPGTVGEYQVYELADFDVSFMLKEAPAGLVVAASAVNDSAVRRISLSPEGGAQLHPLGQHGLRSVERIGRADPGHGLCVQRRRNRRAGQPGNDDTGAEFVFQPVRAVYAPEPHPGRG